ncbi:MAG: group I intron-associated PD-(D/E)XK endonuclease [Cyanobacteriota bacterium]|nr:group I intron-associated PD-(D/E)XK endonuclease [Cyanobacteriota bacterium]
MPKDLSQVKKEVIRLRVEEFLSLREIHEKMGVAKGTLSYWLKPYPLPSDIRQAKQAVAYEKLKKFIKNRPKRKKTSESKFHKALGGRLLSTCEKGRISESAVLFRLTLHGFRVYSSPFDGGTADWLVENPTGRLIKLQVKSVYLDKKGVAIVPLLCSDGRKKRRRYQRGEFDFIVGYCLFSDTAYVLSFGEVEGKTQHTPQEKDIERWDKLLDS